MELLDALLTQLFSGITRDNWKKVLVAALVLLAAAGAFAFWASLPQE